MTTLPATLSNLQTEISALTEKLKPAAESHVADAISSLLAAGFSLPTNLTPEKAPAVYRFALDGVSATALKRTVAKIIRGEIKTNRMYMPDPPEFAVTARAEDRPIIADLARARSIQEAKTQTISHKAYGHGLKDIRVTQRNRSHELSDNGYVLVATGITQETCISLAKSRAIPAGSIHLWAIDEVWAPKAVAHLVDINRVEAKKRSEATATESMTAEDVAYWQKIEDAA